MSKLILSLDGGGIRGAATTQFLSHVETELKQQNQSIRDYVDFYAGTSTGSIIALALATTDLTMSEINDLYNFENAQEIFDPNKGLLEIDGINAPKYEANGKTNLLRKSMGSATLDNVGQDKHVLAVSYAIEKRAPMVIKSTIEAHRSLLASDVADASSAAPTYFPTHEMDIPAQSEDDFFLVDGGVIANNPTMCAVSEVRNIWPHIEMDQIRVLSIGTGFMTRKINGPDSKKWGAAQWMTHGHILDVLSDERVVAYQAMAILNRGAYIRVNAELQTQPGFQTPPDDAMDDVSRKNITRLKSLGDFWFEQYGEQAIALIKGTYAGPSMDRIDPITGKPRARP